MLINCPECELQVSDKAITCPHCGYPLKGVSSRPKNPNKSHKRLPNGFGQITLITSKPLRKPYRAMVTVGRNKNGKPICKLLKPDAYFETYNDAYQALMEYNKNPYDLDDDMTVKELYAEWTAKYFKEIVPSSVRTITAAWAYCSGVENKRVKDIRVGHIKACMESTDSLNTRNRIKSMFNLMLDYALEYGLVDKNYARDFKTEAAETKTQHIAFKDSELNILWKNDDMYIVRAILFQCYTGWRPQELVKIKMSDVDLENMIITSGMKTESGKNRVVPICSKVQPLAKKIYEMAKTLGSEYFICDIEGINCSYDKYYKRFMSVMEKYQFNHRPHDPRKTFVTMAKEKGVDEYAIKYIVGHKIDDITERVYTERTVTWLKDEIEKIC